MKFTSENFKGKFSPEGARRAAEIANKILDDSNLIAAAQELLDACKLALDYLQKEGFHDGDAYPALLKAIAKAEGA